MLNLSKVKIGIVQRYFCIRKRCELLFKNDSCFLRDMCSLNTVNKIVNSEKLRMTIIKKSMIL